MRKERARPADTPLTPLLSSITTCSVENSYEELQSNWSQVYTGKVSLGIRDQGSFSLLSPTEPGVFSLSQEGFASASPWTVICKVNFFLLVDGRAQDA